MSRFDLRGIGMTSQRTRDRLVARLREQGIANESVLAQIRSVPRHIFIDEALAHRAYEDTALPIGFNQTISQPFTVAFMCQALRLDGTETVLEIGTGSGYGAAVLSRLARFVYSIECVPELVRSARERLVQLNYKNVAVREADGSLGLPEEAPFDAIVVAAGGSAVPAALRDQLAVGGRLVMPVGEELGSQTLIRVVRLDENSYEESELAQVRFVPLVRAE